jgi:hypothetical protein
MTRFARTIDISTGVETLVPFTPEEEASANEAVQAEKERVKTAPRDLLAELDALTAALIGKSVVTEADVEAASAAKPAKE